MEQESKQTCTRTHMCKINRSITIRTSEERTINREITGMRHSLIESRKKQNKRKKDIHLKTGTDNRGLRLLVLFQVLTV